MTRPFDEVDVSTYSFWELGATERDDRFAILREKRPVSWQRPAEGMATLPGIEGAGYWAVLRHADVMTVSRDPETYCSSRGYMIEDIPMEILEPAGSFLGMITPGTPSSAVWSRWRSRPAGSGCWRTRSP
ncbi:MAG TPA: hypothetical protein VJ456_07025, partial [Acidimicrobiia bacterium]|nr:hypothetical protein [Acidimicrobiia bacterium]